MEIPVPVCWFLAGQVSPSCPPAGQDPLSCSGCPTPHLLAKVIFGVLTHPSNSCLALTASGISFIQTVKVFIQNLASMPTPSVLVPAGKWVCRNKPGEAHEAQGICPNCWQRHNGMALSQGRDMGLRFLPLWSFCAALELAEFHFNTRFKA